MPPPATRAIRPDQSTRRIGGVEEDALGAGGQPHRLPRGRSHHGIARADLAVVELQVRTPHPDIRHAVEKLVEPGPRVGHGTGVDADDPFGAKPGDQSGHGRAGPERDDDMVKARQLGEQLAAAVHVSLRGIGIRATERDDMRDPAVPSHLLGLPLDLAARLFRRGRTVQTSRAPASKSSTTLPAGTSGSGPCRTSTDRNPRRAAAAAVSRAWLLCGAPLVITVVAPAASACAHVY